MNTEQTPIGQGALYAKIATVMRNLKAFSKDGNYSSDRINFQYISASQAFDAIRKEMAVANLVCIPNIMQTETIDANNNSMIRVTFRMDIVCGDTGAMHSASWQSEVVRRGSDDKVINKAATIGLKYFLMSLFVVTAGDADEDSTAPANNDDNNGYQQPRQNEPSEGYTDEEVKVQTKIGRNNKPYQIIGGITFFSRGVFRELGYTDDVIQAMSQEGVIDLPDPIRIRWAVDNNGYKKPVKVQRVSTEAVAEVA